MRNRSQSVEVKPQVRPTVYRPESFGTEAIHSGIGHISPAEMPPSTYSVWPVM